MSRLESAAQRFMQPMLTGDRTVLDAEGQSTVAVWSVKTAMVLEALDDADLRAYSQYERERLRELGEIPWRTSVWVGAAAEPSHFMSTKNRHLDAAGGTSISGVSITMAFAHIVLQVLTIRLPADVGPATQVTANVRSGPWHEVTSPLWPLPSTPTNWPPRLGLNGESGLNLLADRFMTTGLDETEMDSIVL